MTVFVAQAPRPFRDRVTSQMRLPDLSAATQYGALRFVFSDKDHPGLDTGRSVLKARRELAEFSDDDYLLWAGGDVAALMICSLIAGQVNNNKVRFLRWERSNPHELVRGGAPGYYLPVELRA